jgi:hypothetical protein
MNNIIKRGLSIVLIIILLSMILSNIVMADISFELSNTYLSPDDLPKSITITSNTQNTFTEGKIYPSIKDENSATQTLILLEESDQVIRVQIPDGLSEGTYDIIIGDPNGNITAGDGSKFFNAGEIEIAAAAITSNTPLISLPKGYNTTQDITIHGDYTKFSSSQTVIDIIKDSATIISGTVKSVSDINSYQKELVFILDVGLDTGNYGLRATTGDETLTLTSGAIVIRGVPSLSFPDSFELSEGYAQRTININGTNTGFSDSTVVTVLNDSDEDMDKVSTIVVSSAEEISFSLLTGLTAGNYKFRITTGVETADIDFTVKEPMIFLKEANEDIDIINLGQGNINKEIRVIGQNTNFQSGLTQVFILDENGLDVTDTAIQGAITVVGDVLNFSLNRRINIGEYTVRVATGDESAEDNFSITAPVIQDIIFGSVAYNETDKKLGKGYLDFSVNITGQYLAFNSSSKITIKDNPDKIASVTVDNENSISFTVLHGLAEGIYEIEIDMDGDNNTTNDIFNKSTYPKLEFTVTESGIEGVSPSTVVNASAGEQTITITGTDTHFIESNTDVKITDSSGKNVGTVKNIDVISYESLTFVLDKESIDLPGEYNIHVSVTGGGIIEETVLNNGLTIEAYGISDVSPSYVYHDTLASEDEYLTIAGEGTDFTDTPIVKINDSVIEPEQDISETVMFIKVPANLSPGTHYITVILPGLNPLTSSFIIRPDRKISIDPVFVRTDFSSLQLTVDSDDTIDFSKTKDRPIIIFEKDGGGATSDGTQGTPTADNDTLLYDIPDILDIGDYTVSIKWNNYKSRNEGSDHIGLEFRKDFQVLNRYNELYFMYDNEVVTAINKVKTDTAFNIQVFGKQIEPGNPDIDLTSKVEIEVEQSNSEISYANGTVTPVNKGIATIKADYNGNNASLTVNITEPIIIQQPVLDNDSSQYKPEEPVDLNAEINGETVIITWENNTLICDLYRAVNSEGYELVYSGYKEKYTDVHIENGNIYYYKIQSISHSSKSSFTESVSADFTSTSSTYKTINTSDVESLLGKKEVNTNFVNINIENEVLIEKDALLNLVSSGNGIVVESNNVMFKLPDETLSEIKGSDVKIQIVPVDEQTDPVTPDNGSHTIVTGTAVDINILNVNTDKNINSFDNRITIYISLEGKDLDTIDTRKLGVYYWGIDKETNEPVWLYAGGNYNKETKMLEVTINHLTRFLIMDYIREFSDVPDGHEAKDFIDVLAARHITIGMGNNIFGIGREMTRAQYATFMVRALNIEKREYEGIFTDVKENEWYSLPVEAAYRSEIIKGRGNGIFDPDSSVTKEEMAVMLIRAYENITGQVVEYEESTALEDSQEISEWAFESVYKADELSMIERDENNFFKPKENGKRELMARALVILLELLEYI